MTTIFDSTRTRKSNRPFAVGVSCSTTRKPRFEPSPADLAWASQTLNANARDYTVVGPADSLVDQAAGEAAALNALEAGYANF